jgi:hypothetical protein
MMNKILISIILPLLGGVALLSCSSSDEPFITATEDDYPRILQPWFGQWEDGEPTVYKSISRDIAYVDSVTVTPALYTSVEWFLDGEKINDGTRISKQLLAGEYILKIVATTTKGKTTSRTGKLVVNALDGDPKLSDKNTKRWLIPGKEVSIPCENLTEVKAVRIGKAYVSDARVENGNLKFTVPSMDDGDYQLVVTDGSGTEFGCNKFTVSKDPCPYSDENTVWEGAFNVTWGTPFNALQTTITQHLSPNTIIRAYVAPTNDRGQGSMTTAWWNNILTGKGDPERGDIEITKAMVLEYQVTDFSINLLKAQEGFLIVGDGYTITKVTVGQ